MTSLAMPKIKTLSSSMRSCKPIKSHHASSPPSYRMTQEEVTKLPGLLQEQFHGKEPRSFQIELVRCQQEHRDALCQATTGMGKTAVAAGPYALPGNEGKVMLMISPLIRLQNEMVCEYLYVLHVSLILKNRSQHLRKNMTSLPSCSTVAHHGRIYCSMYELPLLFTVIHEDRPTGNHQWLISHRPHLP